jgi:hypothetical protein
LDVNSIQFPHKNVKASSGEPQASFENTTALDPSLDPQMQKIRQTLFKQGLPNFLDAPDVVKSV